MQALYGAGLELFYREVKLRRRGNETHRAPWLTTFISPSHIDSRKHVWDLERATVAQVHERVLRGRHLAYTTVMTLLTRLAEKGYLRREKEGNAYQYSPAKPPEQVRASVLSDIVDKVFRGSPVALVQTLVRQEDLSGEEQEELMRVIRRLGRRSTNDEREEGDDESRT